MYRIAAKQTGRCSLWVKSGRDALEFRCPLYRRKRTFAHVIRMSVSGQKQTSHFSFEQLISATRQWQGDGDAERLGSLQVDVQLNIGCLLHR
jgi:hypothetical protein